MPLFNYAYKQAKPYTGGAHELTSMDEVLKTPEPELSDLILPGPELEQYKTPASKIWIEPFLTSRSLMLVSAMRGVGKTWFVLQLAVSLLTKTPFLDYDVPHKAKVLIVDGEMPIHDIRNRIKLLSGNMLPENLLVLSSELLARKSMSLNIDDIKIQKAINIAIDKWSPDVIILDNLSSLSFGRDENSNSDLDGLIQWFRDIRYKGIALVIVHHNGKNDKMRGASRLEDILDYSVNLTGKGSETTSFMMNFTKCRRQKPIPLQLICTLKIDNDSAELETESFFEKAKNKARIIAALHDNKYKYHKVLAEELGLDKGQLSRDLKKLEQDGYLTKKPLNLTPKGIKFWTDIISKL